MMVAVLGYRHLACEPWRVLLEQGASLPFGLPQPQPPGQRLAQPGLPACLSSCFVERRGTQPNTRLRRVCVRRGKQHMGRGARVGSIAALRDEARVFATKSALRVPVMVRRPALGRETPHQPTR